MSKNPQPTRRTRGNEGFTMVVIAALFIAFAVIAAAAVERNTATQFINRRDAATAQLTRLANAIIQFGLFNASGNTLLYPCPAERGLATSSISFGAATMPPAYPQACYDSTTDVGSFTAGNIPIMNPVSAGGTANIIRGMVPVQTLAQYGIGLNDALDPWDNRIEYVVNRKLTVGSSSYGTPLTDDPMVSYLGLTAQPADFILISYGRDGAGAVRRNGTVGVACPAAGNRGTNCQLTTTSYISLPTSTYSTVAPAAYFDDIVTSFAQ